MAVDEAKWRGPFRTWAGRVTSLAFLALVASWFWYPGYMVVLFLWFVFCLGAFHCLYLFSSDVTAFQIRLIDYPYVGLGAFGAFFAFQGQHDRDLSLARFAVARQQVAASIDDVLNPAPQTLDGLKDYLSRSKKGYCDSGSDTEKLLARPYCAMIAFLDPFLQQDHAPAVWASVLATLHKYSDDKGLSGPKSDALFITPLTPPQQGYQPYNPSNPMSSFQTPIAQPPPPFAADLAYLRQISVSAKTVLKSLDHVAPPLPPQPEAPAAKPPEPGVIDLIGNLLRYVLWPFVLAVSLALRLTKVTADVTGWAR
jgi:hypothetical protein